jgi:starch synthase
MAASPTRVMGVLAGDIYRQAGMRTKYGLFFEALSRHVTLAGVDDASLTGVPRLLNAARVAHPDRRRWRERVHQNVPAFRTRSRRLADRLRQRQAAFDVVLQVGVLFDAGWASLAKPHVIYTDYTARLSERLTPQWRFPFTPRQAQAWIALERRAFERATHIAVRSAFVRDSVIHDYGIQPERVSVIGGGVNYADLPDRQPRTRTSAPVALFIGKDFLRKGGDVLLRAFAQARTRIPDAQLIIVTGDPIPEGLPLANVEVRPPTWDRRVIAELFQSADVFVLPSRLETWGDVLLEAMAFELPCIGVDAGPMQEIIVPNQTGLVVRPDDEAELGAALARLFEDPNLRNAWGRAGRSRVEQAFTWDHVVRRLVPYIETAASQQSASIRSG